MNKKTQDVPAICGYQRQAGKYYNGAGGARPCMQCRYCISAYEAFERLKKWNRDTANGADSRR